MIFYRLDIKFKKGYFYNYLSINMSPFLQGIRVKKFTWSRDFVVDVEKKKREENIAQVSTR